jgi:hypothetical protein
MMRERLIKQIKKSGSYGKAAAEIGMSRQRLWQIAQGDTCSYYFASKLEEYSGISATEFLYKKPYNGESKSATG